MRTPLEFGPLVELGEVDSTQDYLGTLIRHGSAGCPGVVLAKSQTKGRGRLSRVWVSRPGDSLTMSMAMFGQANASAPWLVGMAVAVCTAEALSLDVQWPNDLCWNGKKVGGILTEIYPTPSGLSVPVVGLGLNLNQTVFDGEIADVAASLFQRDGIRREVMAVALRILEVIAGFPEPSSWNSMETRWQAVDDTRGKVYIDQSGRKAVAISVAEGGKLIAQRDGELVEILAAEALRC